MSRLVGRDFNGWVNDHTLAVEVARLLIMEIQTNARGVDNLSADGRVMQLEGVLAARSNVNARVLRKYVGFVARSIANQVVIEDARISLGLRSGGIDGAGQNVMDDFAVAGDHRCSFYPNGLF